MSLFLSEIGGKLFRCISSVVLSRERISKTPTAQFVLLAGARSHCRGLNKFSLSREHCSAITCTSVRSPVMPCSSFEFASFAMIDQSRLLAADTWPALPNRAHPFRRFVVELASPLSVDSCSHRRNSSPRTPSLTASAFEKPPWQWRNPSCFPSKSVQPSEFLPLRGHMGKLP